MSRIAQTLGLMASFLVYTAGFRQPTLGGPRSSAKGISAQERQALVALYEATEGNHWKNHDHWLGPAGSECTWYGVECEPSASEPTTVIQLDLSENNLHGHVPEAIGQLVHLQTLFLFRNDLSGMLPKPLIRQWLSGSLWVTAEAPLLTDVSEIDYEFSASAILCARYRVVLRSDATAIRFTERCRNASPKDRRTFCEVEKGRIGGEEFAMLAWTLEKNGYFTLQANYQRNISDSVFVSTRVTRNGKKYEVVEYAGGGPLELRIIQLAIEGMSSTMEWSKVEPLPECPRWSKSEVPAPK
jgi:Leucine Rich Repeat (LRR) protein